MKRILLFLLLGSARLFSLHAEEVNGILVKNNGDTIHQLLKIDDKDISNYLSSSNLVPKIKDVNGKKIPIKKYKYIYFKTSIDSFHFYAINISENDFDESSTEKSHFYRLLNNKNAFAKVYEFYDVSDVVGMALTFGIYQYKKLHKSFLVEKKGNYTIITQNGFKGNIKEVIKDNADLMQKVKDGIYTFIDLPLIIAEYNTWYSTK